MTMKIVRFNGDVYVRAADVETWLGERALDLMSAKLGYAGTLAADVLNAARIRFGKIFDQLPKKPDDVMAKPGKVLYK